MEFRILEEVAFSEPLDVTLPDDRQYRVLGIRTVYSYLTRSKFTSAIAQWKLGNRWMNTIALNGKSAIDLAAYLETCPVCLTCGKVNPEPLEVDPNDPPAWACGQDPCRCEFCGSVED